MKLEVYNKLVQIWKSTANKMLHSYIPILDVRYLLHLHNTFQPTSDYAKL